MFDMERLIGAFPQGFDAKLRIDDPRFDEPVEMVRDHLNRLGVSYFNDMANSAEAEPVTGTQALIVCSRALEHGIGESVIPMAAPMGNGVWPHIVARAEAISERAFHLGLRGENDGPVPVLVTAAPSMKSHFDL